MKRDRLLEIRGKAGFVPVGMRHSAPCGRHTGVQTCLPLVKTDVLAWETNQLPGTLTTVGELRTSDSSWIARVLALDRVSTGFN
jgi:hypothetical protein